MSTTKILDPRSFDDPLPSKRPTNDTTTNSPTTKNRFLGLLLFVWFIYLIGVLAVLGLFVAVNNGLFGTLPTFTELENPKSALASEVYSADSVLLGKFFVFNRSNAAYEELPKHLIDALVCTEDVRFYDHSGIDFRGTMRVLFKTILQGQDAGGGSTVTQQLAKNLFHERPKTTLGRVKQKLKEWVIAVKLEKGYTKEEIATMYFNTVPFSGNAHGIKSAARTYFSCSTDSLNIQQSAVLVGMLKANTKFNPRLNPEESEERRNVVLAQMMKYGALTPAEHDSIKQLPLVLEYKIEDHDQGYANYFREHVREYMKKWATNNQKVNGENYDIHRDGLRVYTTINSKMQKYAEQAVATHMPFLQKQFNEHWKGKTPWHGQRKLANAEGGAWDGLNALLSRAVKQSTRYRSMKYDQKKSVAEIKKAFTTPRKMRVFAWNGEKDAIGNNTYEITKEMSPLDSIRYYKYFLHAGFMAMDPHNGHVLAWAGGINYQHFKYDNVRKSSKRQVGSTFKPLVFTLAIDNGWSPCRKVPNSRVYFPEYNNWSPRNAGRYKSGQMVTLKEGLAHSINRVTAYLMKQLRPQPVVDIARKMGIDSPMDAYPSICLGTPDISVIEMVGAYSTFANKGIFTAPNFITRIEDKNGNIVQEFPTTDVEVTSEQTAYVMLDMLQDVTEKGTGRRLRHKYKMTAPIAGKTGTTNDNSDGWYIGIVPNLIAGAWVGGDEKQIHFRSTALGGGSNMSLPIWAEFMQRVYADGGLGYSQNDKFEVPYPLDIETDCSKYYKLPPKAPNAPVQPLEGSAVSRGPAPGTAPKPKPKKKDYNDEFE